MSSYVRDQWFYQVSGRDIKLYIKKDVPIGTPDQLGRFSYGGSNLDYPDEDITNGLRVEYTALIEPFVAEAFEDVTARASGTKFSFNDDGDSASGYNDLYDTADGLTDFEDGDRIRVIGSASNDGDYTLTADAGGARYIQIGTGNLTDEAAGESITIYQIPKAVADISVDESSHLNLNRMLSLAAVDYVRAQMKEAVGDLQGKEYCMREFWKKIGDNESNKRNISMTFPASPFAVK